METRNSFAVRRRGLLLANSLIAASLRIFWLFCDGNGPRRASVITVRTLDSPFRAHAAVRAQKLLGKVEPSFNSKLRKSEEIKSIFYHNDRYRKENAIEMQVYQIKII